MKPAPKAYFAARCRCAERHRASAAPAPSKLRLHVIRSLTHPQLDSPADRQILNALPGSVSQTWHSDNRSRGLTIIVPLVDFTAENGSTQLIVGSHNKTWPLIAEQGGRVVEAPVGSIAVFDSRTYHRGLGNETNDGRPALIFCYDRPSSPPPGYSGVYGSISHALLAGTLNIASAAWITCADAWTRE